MDKRKKILCQFCGMSLFNTSKTCPKCDSDIENQYQSNTLTVDVAHNKETVKQAIDKLYQIIERNQNMKHRQIRVIVGSKLIREEVMRELEMLKRRKAIVDFRMDEGNSGALIMRMENGKLKRI